MKIMLIYTKEEGQILGMCKWDTEKELYEVYLREDNKDSYVIAFFYKRKIENWFIKGLFPFGKNNELCKPFKDEWWLHCKELFVHNIKLSNIITV